jgi:hypothetical protein
MNFAEALNVKLDEIKRPPLPPRGHYVWKITKLPEMGKMKNGEYDTVTFTCSAISPGEDVDTDQLREFGGVKNVTTIHRFLFDNNDKTKLQRSLFNMKNFLTEHVKIDVGADASLKELLNSATGGTFLGELKYRPDPDNPEIMYVEMGKTAAAD